MHEERPTSIEQLSAIDSAIRLYFQPLRERLNMVEQFVFERQYPHEVSLLLCTYLDALATTVLANRVSSSEARLAALLETFSSFGPGWAQVSLPDLYELLVSVERHPILYREPWAPEESALRKSLKALGFSMKDPDEHEVVARVLRDISEKLTCLGRAMPEQHMGPSVLEATKVCSGLGPHLGEALKPVIERFRLSSILYRNFRCASVHQLHLPTWLTEDETFWSEEEPYFVTIEYEKALPGMKFLTLVFPARFMLRALKECMDRVQENLIATRTMPLDIYWTVFFGTELEDFVTLDESTL